MRKINKLSQARTSTSSSSSRPSTSRPVMPVIQESPVIDIPVRGYQQQPVLQQPQQHSMFQHQQQPEETFNIVASHEVSSPSISQALSPINQVPVIQEPRTPSDLLRDLNIQSPQPLQQQHQPQQQPYQQQHQLQDEHIDLNSIVDVIFRTPPIDQQQEASIISQINPSSFDIPSVFDHPPAPNTLEIPDDITRLLFEADRGIAVVADGQTRVFKTVEKEKNKIKKHQDDDDVSDLSRNMKKLSTKERKQLKVFEAES